MKSGCVPEFEYVVNMYYGTAALYREIKISIPCRTVTAAYRGVRHQIHNTVIYTKAQRQKIFSIVSNIESITVETYK